MGKRTGNPKGRPATGKYICSEMVDAIEDYIQTCMKVKKVPILKEVVVKMGWNYNTVQKKRLLDQYKDLDEELYRLQDVKEYMLERLGLEGKIEKTLAVFSLKQLGWKDQQDVVVGNNQDQGLKVTLVVAE